MTIKAAGTVKITITAKATSSYKAATKTLTVKVAKAAPVLKTKISSRNISYNALRKKAQVFTLGASVSSKGKLTYAKTAGSSAVDAESMSCPGAFERAKEGPEERYLQDQSEDFRKSNCKIQCRNKDSSCYSKSEISSEKSVT